jgi:hypothetical protein
LNDISIEKSRTETPRVCRDEQFLRVDSGPLLVTLDVERASLFAHFAV